MVAVHPAKTANWSKKGKMGKTRADMMQPMALEASLIISMAILMRLRRKMTMTRMMKRQTPQTIERPNQV